MFQFENTNIRAMAILFQSVLLVKRGCGHSALIFANFLAIFQLYPCLEIFSLERYLNDNKNSILVQVPATEVFTPLLTKKLTP